MVAKKVDSARALIARGWRLSFVSRCLQVSRAHLHVLKNRPGGWQDGRKKRQTDDADVLERINGVIGEVPTRGYRCVWALLRRESETLAVSVVNAKRGYRIMCQHALLPGRKSRMQPAGRAHTGKVAVSESNRRWCSDGFEFRCDNGEKLRVTFALDCCDREALHWAAGTGGFDSDTVQDVMLGAVERRFGHHLPQAPIEWLTDNSSAYRAHDTRRFTRLLGLEPKRTAVRSPESNGMAESFVKTMKRDYISVRLPFAAGISATPAGLNKRVDESGVIGANPIKVNGRWAYLYRAVDSRGRTLDFYLSSRRNSKAAYRFLGKILNNVKGWQIPRLINTYKAPTYGRALALLKREGRCPPDVEHRPGTT